MPILPLPAESAENSLSERLEKEAQAIYWRNHREELEAMGGFSAEGLEGKELLKQTAGPQDALMEAPQDGAPWDMLMAQAASGEVGSGEEASLQAVPAGNAGSGSTGTGKQLLPEKEKTVPKFKSKGRKGLGPG